MRTSLNPDHLRGKPLEYRLAYHSSAPTDTGCILWTGAKNSRTGYGRLRYDGGRMLAHRVAYTLKFGPIPEGMQVLHKCDNPYCVAPDHLFLGTNADNVADKVSKGRQARNFGEKHPSAKFTEDVIRVIRADNRLHKVIAREYGCCRSTISYIKAKKLWPHVT